MSTVQTNNNNLLIYIAQIQSSIPTKQLHEASYISTNHKLYLGNISLTIGTVIKL